MRKRQHGGGMRGRTQWSAGGDEYRRRFRKQSGNRHGWRRAMPESRPSFGTRSAKLRHRNPPSRLRRAQVRVVRSIAGADLEGRKKPQGCARATGFWRSVFVSEWWLWRLCRTYGAPDESALGSQPFRAGLNFAAPPAPVLGCGWFMAGWDWGGDRVGRKKALGCGLRCRCRFCDA